MQAELTCESRREERTEQ